MSRSGVGSWLASSRRWYSSIFVSLGEKNTPFSASAACNFARVQGRLEVAGSRLGLWWRTFLGFFRGPGSFASVGWFVGLDSAFAAAAGPLRRGGRARKPGGGARKRGSVAGRSSSSKLGMKNSSMVEKLIVVLETFCCCFDNQNQKSGKNASW